LPVVVVVAAAVAVVVEERPHVSGCALCGSSTKKVKVEHLV